MRLLALETSEYVSGLALWRDGEVAAEHSFPSRMNLCETLTARLRDLLGGEPAGTALDAIAVSQGPGSFTGLRVGMATAKALAHVCSLPLVGVPTQQVLASAADCAAGETVCVLQKARQGHVYAGLWQKTESGAAETAPLEVVAVLDLPAWLAGRATLLTGPGCDEAMSVLDALPDTVRLQASMPAAAWVARLGVQLLPSASPQAAFNLQPLYVLASQAERQKGLDLSAPPRPRILLRRAELSDLQDIMRIEVASFSSPWHELSIREELCGRPGSFFITLEFDGQIAGYAGTWIFAGETHICTIAVDPAFRRRGLAELLMFALLRHSQSLGVEYALLEYRVSNTAAATLYEKLGFEFVHIRKRYYQDNNEDAVVSALPDLCTPARRQHLDNLYLRWQERYPYEVSLEV